MSGRSEAELGSLAFDSALIGVSSTVEGTTGDVVLWITSTSFEDVRGLPEVTGTEEGV